MDLQQPRGFGSINQGPRRSLAMHGDEHWLTSHWYERPREDPAWPDVHLYTDALAYDPGGRVRFFASTTAACFALEIYRDGMVPQLVHSVSHLPGTFTPMPSDAYRSGCGWPEIHRWQIPSDMPSGFYVVVSSCDRPNGSRYVQHHFLVVRPVRAAGGRILLILPTATWTSYNDWGGANAYLGVDGPGRDQYSPILSLDRPWTRGVAWLPQDAPRVCSSARPGPWSPPRYALKEWAWANGFGQSYAAAGWAQYDRHFAVWAERRGIALDFITQTDLHYEPERLQPYACVAIVGHDEYWTREMRESMERYVEGGGHFARFGANFIWQTRLEEAGRRQVCYKYRARAEDPVRGTDRAHLITSAWEDRLINWPGASTVGVNGLRGIYASWGGFAPRGSHGFTVFRPGHWAFAGTDLYYGDIFGDAAHIFGYEVDGLDYTFRDGLPYPTGRDGAATDIDILAMAPAVKFEQRHPGDGFRYYVGEHDLQFCTEVIEGTADSDAMDRHRYGSGMVVSMKKGRGEVFTAGSCEWVMGLAHHDPFTEQITRNVLERFTARN
jgi:hypothetical protein